VSGVAARWTIAWAGAAALATLNGAVRERLLAGRMDEPAAHRASTGALVVLLAAYMAALQRRRPLPDDRAALRAGATWLGLTLAFETALGRLAQGLSWREVMRDYDLRRGRLWPLALAWIALGPAVVRRLVRAA
jgi:hypothetical protein